MSEPGSPLSLTPVEKRRAERVDLLASQGAGGVAELLGMLDEPSWAVRRNVVASLASLGDVAVAPLREMLRTRRDNEARIAATVDALVGSLGNVQETIGPLASDGDPAIVADVAQILGRRKDPAGVAILTALAAHENDNVSVTAIEGLGRVGGRAAVDSLEKIVRSGNFFRTFPAIDVLGRSGDPRAVAPLTTLLQDPLYQLEAARALGRTGDMRAVAPLAGLLLLTGEAHIRLAAVALADLQGRFQAQYNLTAPFDDALRRAVPPGRAVRQLARVVMSALPEEQAAICLILGRLGSSDAVPVLTPLLDIPAVADAAARALDQLGAESEHRLFQALHTGTSARRLVLLPLVNRSAALDDVLICLGDSDPQVRVLACEAISRLGQQSALTRLFALLADPNPRVSHAATGAIQALGGPETERLAIAAMHSEVASVPRAAIRILSYFGYPSALPALQDAYRNGDVRLRDQAIQGLAFIDNPEALELLLVATRHPSARVRAQAARSLGNRSSDDPRVAAALLRALDDADAWVRYYALQSLGRLECDSAVDAMARHLGDEAGQVQVAAVEALSHLAGEKALAALRKAAHSTDVDVERAALVGLGLTRDQGSLPTLMQALESPQAATRLVALSAVSVFPDQQVLEALCRLAVDRDESVQSSAIGFLAARPGVNATVGLIQLLRTLPKTGRVLAALATHTAGRVIGIASALETADDELALQLTSALVRLRRPDAVDVLISVLARPNVAARKAAATTLSALDTSEARAALRRASTDDPDAEVRRLCVVALGP